MSGLGEGTLGKYSCLSEKPTELSAQTNGAEKAHCRVTHLSATTNQHDGVHWQPWPGPVIARVSKASSFLNWSAHGKKRSNKQSSACHATEILFVVCLEIMLILPLPRAGPTAVPSELGGKNMSLTKRSSTPNQSCLLLIPAGRGKSSPRPPIECRWIDQPTTLQDKESNTQHTQFFNTF